MGVSHLHEPSMHTHEEAIPHIPWLESQSAGYVRRIISQLAVRRADLIAAILFGSAARQSLRPLTDPIPSDIDILLIFAAAPGQERVSSEQQSATSWAMVDAMTAYPDAPREAQLIAVLPDFIGWDSSFVGNIARDGILLWARGTLPPPLASVAERTLSATSTTEQAERNTDDHATRTHHDF